MELALAANDDIYIVCLFIFRPIADIKISRKIENLNLLSLPNWPVISPRKQILRNRKKFKQKSSLKIKAKLKINSVNLIKNPVNRLLLLKLKKNLRNQLMLIFLMWLANLLSPQKNKNQLT